MVDNSASFCHASQKTGRAVDITLEPIVRRPAKDLQVTFVRELEDADIALANRERAGGLPTTNPIARLRESHHAPARLLAMGESPQGVAVITGMSLSAIYRLQQDPTFRGLIEFYRKNLDLAAVDMQQRLSTLNADFVQELQDRIQDAPEKMSDGFVLKAIETLSDRTGHGPINRAVNINVAVGMAERLQAARQRALVPPTDKEEAA